MIHWKSLRCMPLRICLGLLASIAAADNTEIFTQVLPPADPNILFIVDTSGSMDSDVIVSAGFDPSVTYAGNCNPNHTYYQLITGSNISVPSCATGEPSTFVNNTAFRCKAGLTAFSQVGFYEDRAAQWDDVNLEWTFLIPAFTGSPTPGRDRMVECAADYGVDGDGVDNTKLYPENGTDGPWNESPAHAIVWPRLDRYQF